jgi:hypothetical protein
MVDPSGPTYEKKNQEYKEQTVNQLLAYRDIEKYQKQKNQCAYKYENR